jgi:hypothetical protein
MPCKSTAVLASVIIALNFNNRLLKVQFKGNSDPFLPLNIWNVVSQHRVARFVLTI